MHNSSDLDKEDIIKDPSHQSNLDKNEIIND